MPEAKQEKPSPERILAAAVRAGYCTAEQAVECRKAYDVVLELGLNETFESVVKKKGILTEEQIRDIERRIGKIPVVGNYELLERIGQGGMGTVFRARQISMDRTVALKILTPRLASNKAFVERFMREARASAKLNHPNVIQGIDVGEAGGYYYFAMEFVDGPTVRKVLQDEGHFPPEKALDIVIQIVSALEHAHANGLVHRDIKPDNIMLTKTGIAKLCDLGLARMTGEDSNLTIAGQAIGTPHYIAPEQARGVQDIDIRADIYSLGATFYHMTVGKTLFVGNSSADIMSKHIVEEASFPVESAGDVPPDYFLVMAMMMAKDREERYQTPAELLKDLEALKAGRKPGLAAAFAGKSSIQLPGRGGAMGRIAERLSQTGGSVAAVAVRGSAKGRASYEKPARSGIPPWAVIAASAAGTCMIGLAFGLMLVARRGGDRTAETPVGPVVGAEISSTSPVAGGRDSGSADSPRQPKAVGGMPAVKTAIGGADRNFPAASGMSAGTDSAPAEKAGGAPAALKNEREEKAAKVLEECLAEIAEDPGDHAGNIAALEALRDAVKGTSAEAKLNAAIAAEKAAVRREAVERWDNAQRRAEEFAEARRFVSAIGMLGEFRRAGHDEKLAKAAGDLARDIERRASETVKAAARAAVASAGKGDMEEARKALEELSEGEVPEACAAELRAAKEAVAAAEAKAKADAEKSGAKTREALYGRYAGSVLGAAIAKSGGDIEKVLEAAKDAAGKDEFGPVAERIAEDVRGLEECLRIEAAAIEKWAARSKGQIVDMPKAMPGMTKGRIQDAKGRRVYIVGGTSGTGPTFCFTAGQFPAHTIIEMAGLDTSSAEGAAKAAAYFAARGETAAALKTLAPFRESGDPTVAMLLSRIGAAEAVSRDAAAEEALARLEGIFSTSKDEKALAEALKEYEEKHGAADFSRREDTAKRLAALRAKLDAFDPLGRLTSGRLHRLADGWYELVYTFDNAAQVAEFELDRAMQNEPETRSFVAGGRLLLRTGQHKDGEERRSINISVLWKPRIPIESIRKVEYDIVPSGGGKWIGWYAYASARPGGRQMFGKVRMDGEAWAENLNGERSSGRAPAGWRPNEAVRHLVAMSGGGIIEWFVSGMKVCSVKASKFTALGIQSKGPSELAIGEFRVEFKPADMKHHAGGEGGKEKIQKAIPQRSPAR